MITCKQDLINTAVFCSNAELRDLYISKCKQFGILWVHNLDINKYSLLYVSDGAKLHGVQTDADVYYQDHKRLTISDLKPRTKVEYKKVKLSLPERIEILESGEWLYLDPDGRTHIDMHCTANWTVGALRDKEVYRKVERPVEWWEDAAEFIVENDDDDLSAYFDKQSGGLRINTNLPRDKWCDFARILLEQEGE